MKLFNLFKWIFNPDFYTFRMGGGGAPTQTTSYQTNIPEYAQPYVEQMLGATQRQIYTGTTGPEGQFQPTGFQQFVPFGATYQMDAQGKPIRDAQGNLVYTNTPTQQAQATVAPFSPLQQQAMMGLGSYVQPQQGSAASQIAGDVAGRSAASGYYSPLVAERFQLGRPQQVYSDSFTAPGVSRAYMSPYMQNVVNVQQREARRASEIARQQQQAQAVGAGAFGGSRQAIVEAERQRNLAQQLGDIQAQGLQQAYGAGMGQFNAEQQAYLAAQQANQQANLQAAIQNLQAQQAAQQLQEQSRQFGAGLGIQGYGQTLQAAQLLGQQGAQEFQQDMAALQAKMQAGGMEQAQQQRVLDQAIQNYATQQQYPLMQLGVLSNMLRGLPMQATTTQAYQTQPSAINQALGLAGAGLGVYQQGKTAGLFKKGGEVKMAPGGVATGVQPGKLADMAEMMRDEDLQKKMQDKETDPATKNIFQSETMRRQKLRGMAGGGIVAFKKAGKVSLPKDMIDTSGEKDPTAGRGIQTDAPDVQGFGGLSPTTPGAMAQYQEGVDEEQGPSVSTLQQDLGVLSGRMKELGEERKASVPDIMTKIAGEREQMGIVDPTAGRQKELDERKARIDADAKELAMSRLSQFLIRWGQTPGSAMRGAIEAGSELVANNITDTKERKKALDQLDDAKAALNEAEYLRKVGDMDKAQARIDKAGKDFFDVAKDLASIKAQLAIKQLDAETKREIQQLKNDLAVAKGQNKTAVLQVADAYFKAAIEQGAPANATTYETAIKQAARDMPGVISAGIATGPRYAGVSLEGDKLKTVDKPGAEARVSEAKINAQKQLTKELRTLTATNPAYQAAIKGKTKEEKAAIRERFEQEIKNKPAYDILREGASAAPAPAPTAPTAPAARAIPKWDPQTQSWK
jgi:hypothetical protein